MTKAVFFIKVKTHASYYEYAMTANRVWFSRGRAKGYGSQWSKWRTSNDRYYEKLNLSIGEQFEDCGNHCTIADPTECNDLPELNSVEQRIELAISELDMELITHVEFAEIIREALNSNISIIQWHKVDNPVDQELWEPILTANASYPNSLSLANFIKDRKFGHTSEKELRSPTHFAWMPKGPKVDV